GAVTGHLEQRALLFAAGGLHGRAAPPDERSSATGRHEALASASSPSRAAFATGSGRTVGAAAVTGPERVAAGGADRSARHAGALRARGSRCDPGRPRTGTACGRTTTGASSGSRRPSAADRRPPC